MSSPAWPARPELVLSGCFRGGSGGAERAKVGPGSAARAPGGERFLCPTPATPPFPLYSRGALAFQNPWLFPCVPCPCGPTGQRPSLSVLVRWLRRPCLCLREALGDRPLCPSPSAFLPLLRPFSAFPQGADTSWPRWQVAGFVLPLRQYGGNCRSRGAALHVYKALSTAPSERPSGAGREAEPS